MSFKAQRGVGYFQILKSLSRDHLWWFLRQCFLFTLMSRSQIIIKLKPIILIKYLQSVIKITFPVKRKMCHLKKIIVLCVFLLYRNIQRLCFVLFDIYKLTFSNVTIPSERRLTTLRNLCFHCCLTLFISQNIFVQNTKCTCPNYKIYLSKKQNIFVQHDNSPAQKESGNIFDGDNASIFVHRA